MELALKMSELDVLVEQLTGLEDLSEEEKANENEGKKTKTKNRKTEQNGVKALDMRKKAMDSKTFGNNKQKAPGRKSAKE